MYCRRPRYQRDYSPGNRLPGSSRGQCGQSGAGSQGHAPKIAQAYPSSFAPTMPRKRRHRGITKAPTPLVSTNALAALSLTAQAHADVKRVEKLQGPTGPCLLTIADSGERKSTCNDFFIQAIRDYEAKQAERSKPLIKDCTAAMEAWKAKHSSIKEKSTSLPRRKSLHMSRKPTCAIWSTTSRNHHECPD